MNPTAQCFNREIFSECNHDVTAGSDMKDTHHVLFVTPPPSVVDDYENGIIDSCKRNVETI